MAICPTTVCWLTVRQNLFLKHLLTDCQVTICLTTVCGLTVRQSTVSQTNLERLSSDCLYINCLSRTHWAIVEQLFAKQLLSIWALTIMPLLSECQVTIDQLLKKLHLSSGCLLINCLSNYWPLVKQLFAKLFFSEQLSEWLLLKWLLFEHIFVYNLFIY